MELVKVRSVAQIWALPKDVAKFVGYKSPTRFLNSFRAFCEKRPNYFKPLKPIRAYDGVDTTYNLICIAHYYEMQELLDAGSRSIKFKDDIERIREAYGL